MEENIIFKLNNIIYSNNNDILLNVINTLENIINDSKNDIIIKRLKDIIVMLNKIIEQNQKNKQEIINYIVKLDKDININFKEIKDIIINNKKKKKKNNNFNRFINQKISDKREEKKILNFNGGNRYKDNMKIYKKRGKGKSGLNSSFEHPRNHRFKGPGFMEYIGPHASMGTIQQRNGPLGFEGELMPMRSHRFIKQEHGSLGKYRGNKRPKKIRNSSLDKPYRFDGPVRKVRYEYEIYYGPMPSKCNRPPHRTMSSEFRGPHGTIQYDSYDSEGRPLDYW